ncbi:MAG TPA: radical SAM protein [Polyangia bacterium]|nr:radical SAM protein [Polyangia bacterium]
MRVLLVTPPMTQLNTPYPATAYLTGCLRAHAGPGVEVRQADLSLALFLRLYSSQGLTEVAEAIAARGPQRGRRRSPSVAHFLAHRQTYVDRVEAVIRFLQGRDATLALRIAGRDFLPEGPRFAALGAHDDDSDGNGDGEALNWAFGQLGTTDRARHLASLCIDDLGDAIRDGVDPRFELSRYAESLASSAPTFDGLLAALDGPETLVDRALDELTGHLLRTEEPDLVGLTLPFPGNVYGALRIARIVKAQSPRTRVVLGGGYVNTELRALSDGRVFDLVDYVTLDDGERPLLALLDHLRDPARPLLRTFVRRGGGPVSFQTTAALADLHHREAGTPTYDGLPLDRYVSLLEMLNPMHRLWSDGRWNKLTVARGCYWKKCTFCDVSLDYIARYEPASAAVTVDRIEALVRETGQTGFHFVDEAAPPAALRALALALIERRIGITWWGNIRFEKSFTPELVQLLARSGCVAISGGLEVASDRLLALMKKGVTVAQVARVARAFSQAGVLVHAYLMYGFPTETEQETVDALERVRQLFVEGCIQSAFWHRFAATAHSPIGQRPELFGIRLLPQAPATFARNEIPFVDPTGCDHERLGIGLRKALYNFMHGVGLDADVCTWFEHRVPAPQVARDLIRRALVAPVAGRSGAGRRRSAT